MRTRGITHLCRALPPALLAALLLAGCDSGTTAEAPFGLTPGPGTPAPATPELRFGLTPGPGTPAPTPEQRFGLTPQPFGLTPQPTPPPL